MACRDRRHGRPCAIAAYPEFIPQEQTDFSYAFVNTFVEGVAPAEGRWSAGTSIDGKGEFSIVPAEPLGEEPVLAMPRPDSGAQSQQMSEEPIGQTRLDE